MTQKIPKYLRGLGRRNDKIKVSHNLLFPAIAAGDLREEDPGMASQVIEKFLGQGRHIAQPELTDALVALFDRLQDVLELLDFGVVLLKLLQPLELIAQLSLPPLKRSLRFTT